MSLQVSRSMVENMRLPTENTFECGAKFGAKDGVNDRIKCGIEITQPQEKADQCPFSFSFHVSDFVFYTILYKNLI